MYKIEKNIPYKARFSKRSEPAVKMLETLKALKISESFAATYDQKNTYTNLLRDKSLLGKRFTSSKTDLKNFRIWRVK